jgi:hypothetical protein
MSAGSVNRAARDLNEVNAENRDLSMDLTVADFPVPMTPFKTHFSHTAFNERARIIKYGAPLQS